MANLYGGWRGSTTQPGGPTQDPVTGLFNNNMGSTDPNLIAAIRKNNPNYGNVPPGYEFDAATGGYDRTPLSAGQRAGQYTQGAMGGIPSLAGLFGGAGGAGGSGGIGGTGTGGTGGGIGGTGAGGGSYVAPIQMPDTTAATNAAFARAKDQAGSLSRASLDSLSGELGSQGMLGSGAQLQGTANILSGATNTMGKEISSEAGQTAGIAADFAKTGYEGNITQRGQDIAAREAEASRNQQVLLSLLAGLRGGKQGTYGAGTGSAGAGGGGNMLY
jgi:hypothetical protein